MSPTLRRVIKIVADHSGVPVEKLDAASAIGQDIKITGDDVTELAEILAEEFGDQIRHWPWHRFAELGEWHVFAGLWLLWRLLTWPIRGRLLDPSPYGRLELGHIAAVLDAGEWFEPAGTHA